MTADSPRLDVDRLELRVPGHDRDAGAALAGELTRRLGDLDPAARTELGVLRLQVPCPASASPEEVATRVTAALREALS